MHTRELRHTLLKENSLQQGVLVAEHQTLVGSSSMGRLQVMEVRLMNADSFLELLDVLGSSLTEGSLGLSVSLLALLGRGVDL